MNNHTDPPGPDGPMRWNDIRRVGPALMLALAAVLMINPSFVGGTSSVGGDAPDIICTEALDLQAVGVGLNPCDEPCVLALAVGSIADPCIEEHVDPCSGGFLTELPDGSCCLDPSAAGVFVPFCPEPEPEPEPEPAPEVDNSVPFRPLDPPLERIMGPIYPGAIQVDSITDGVHELDFPPLLARFIGDNVVTITDRTGKVVFEGQIGGGVLLFTEAFPLTVEVILETNVHYTEIVGAASSS